ncbi:protein adenylyltransferase SelO, mitochondrial [Gastrophryne carolinensis]
MQAVAMMKRAVHSSASSGSGLRTLCLDDRVLRCLPMEPGDGQDEEAVRPRQVPGYCFSPVRPSPVHKPQVVALSQAALALLGLQLGEHEEDEAAMYFSGNRLLPGSRPAAHCYCGHQFGNFAGQLGDGAAMYLGEVQSPSGERWELQLKGAGLTPYSRQADGRKVLRSSIREFLCSEAMFHLGIPTTRAASCVTSDSKVIRDIYYDGNPKLEKCTIVLRVAPTFLRFGSFEIFKPMDDYTGREGPSVNRNDIRIQMLDYVVGTFYPEIQEKYAGRNTERNAEFFREITKRTARLVAEWQCVGFCHGVLNTDNMSILGLTIDYGPFGFLDRYDPDHICNGSDEMGRYAYSRQPEICKWNLGKFSEALVPELPLETSENIIEEEYDAEYKRHYMQKMRRKLGLQLELEEDQSLISDLLDTMNRTGSDFTNTFRVLSKFSGKSTDIDDFLNVIMKHCATLDELKIAFKPKMDPRQVAMMQILAQTNPQLHSLFWSNAGMGRRMKNYEKYARVEQSSNEELLSTNRKHWNEWLQAYSTRLEKEHSEDKDALYAQRVQIMNANNPACILRNYIAQNAIEAAENGDFTEVRRVLKMLENPYEEDEQVLEVAEEKQPEACAAAATRPSEPLKRPYNSKPPLWATELCVT